MIKVKLIIQNLLMQYSIKDQIELVHDIQLVDDHNLCEKPDIWIIDEYHYKIRNTKQMEIEPDKIILIVENKIEFVNNEVNIVFCEDCLIFHLPVIIRLINLGGCYHSSHIFKYGKMVFNNEINLTEKQKKIMCKVFDNPEKTIDEIACEIGISKNTFNTHLQSIYRKLSVSNLTAALIKCIKITMK
jgi:DNA-binding CsgD family transcriptional regulator